METPGLGGGGPGSEGGGEFTGLNTMMVRVLGLN